MEDDNVVIGLHRKRQVIADELELAQGRVRQLVLDIDAVDATILLFRPGTAIPLDDL